MLQRLLKRLSAVTLIAAAPVSKADLFVGMSTGRDYMQTGAFVSEFRGGDLYLILRDGFILLSPCADHPSPVPVPPNIFCPLGTNGFIADGDFDNDGVRDDLSFWSIAEIVPAAFIEPFAPELCLLQSAPPSKLPRPLGLFSDRGVLAFYDIFTANVLQYDVTLYEWSRNYGPGAGGRSQMEDEVVFGQYIFTFPRLNFPQFFLPISITYRQIPEAVDVTSRYPETGFYFTSGVWRDGFYLMDPRITTPVTWSGNTPLNTFPGSDELRLSILDDTETLVLFPPSQTPLLIPNPLEQQYLLPPFFFDIGDTAVFRLRLDRTLGSSAVAYDTSVRLFNFRVRFVDSYRGFRQVTFPSGSSDMQTRANDDFDGDGQTNLYEFGMQSDPLSAASTAPDPVAVQNMDGTVSFSLAKRPNGAVNYVFQVSELGGPFRNIGATDSTWDITVDDDTTLTITTKLPAAAADFSAKVRVTEILLLAP